MIRKLQLRYAVKSRTNFYSWKKELESEEWHASLKPRRADSRDFLKWLIENRQVMNQ